MRTLLESIFGGRSSITHQTESILIEDAIKDIRTGSSKQMNDPVYVNGNKVTTEATLIITPELWEKYKDIIPKYEITAYSVSFLDGPVDMKNTKINANELYFDGDVKNLKAYNVQQVSFGPDLLSAPKVVISDSEIESNGAIQYGVIFNNLKTDLKNTTIKKVKNIKLSFFEKRAYGNASRIISKLFDATEPVIDAKGKRVAINSISTYKKYIKGFPDFRYYKTATTGSGNFKLKSNMKLTDIFPWINSFPDLETIVMDEPDSGRKDIMFKKAAPTDNHLKDHMTADGWILNICGY